MNQDYNIAIVSTDIEKDATISLCKLLDFMGEPYTCYNADDIEKIPSLSAYTLTLIASSNSIEKHSDTLADVLTESATAIMFIHYNTYTQALDIPDRLKAKHISTMTPPLTLAQALDSLYLCQISQEHSQDQLNPFVKRGLDLYSRLVGTNKDMLQARNTAQAVAEHDEHVLIRGDMGTSKEMIARNIHHHSARHEQAFVALNVQTIPNSLLDIELFGCTEKSHPLQAGAVKGRILSANGGAFFIDDIGFMPLATQEKLLKVLQNNCITPIGGTKEQALDIRFYTGTRQNLAALAKHGFFSEVLCALLYNEPIELPPLKQRSSDLFILINETLASAKAHDVTTIKKISDTAMQALKAYTWPGNDRELANLIERLSYQHPNMEIELNHLPQKLFR